MTKKLKWARAWHKAHPYYSVYAGAKQRCENPSNPEYPRYGGRGIKFLFRSYKEFVRTIGPKPKGTSMDRINNDGHYRVGNVRWATLSQQAFNRRKTSAIKPCRWCGRI